jgi:hypothetical protein
VWARDRTTDLRLVTLGQQSTSRLEAYERALSGKPDRVRTMFGSTCGSGFHKLIYMQREVSLADACSGRSLVLGRFDEPLDVFPQRNGGVDVMASPVVGRVPSVARRGTSTLIATIPVDPMGR